MPLSAVLKTGAKRSAGGRARAVSVESLALSLILNVPLVWPPGAGTLVFPELRCSGAVSSPYFLSSLVF